MNQRHERLGRLDTRLAAQHPGRALKLLGQRLDSLAERLPRAMREVLRIVGNASRPSCRPCTWSAPGDPGPRLQHSARRARPGHPQRRPDPQRPAPDRPPERRRAQGAGRGQPPDSGHPLATGLTHAPPARPSARLLLAVARYPRPGQLHHAPAEQAGARRRGGGRPGPCPSAPSARFDGKPVLVVGSRATGWPSSAFL